MNLHRLVLNRLGPLKVALRALRHRNYRIFFVGQGISLTGTWMQRTALAWLVYRMTGSKTLLGVVAFASMFPMFVLAPLAGVLSDRVERRPILILTQSLAMLQAFVLAALVMTHTIQVWHIVALGVFMGLTVAFDMPTRQAFVVEMVNGRQDLGNAIALNSLLFNSARFVGPALAGVLIKVLATSGRGGEGPVFLINGVTFLAVIASYFAMRLPPRTSDGKDKQVWAELVEGVRYAIRSPATRSVLLLLAVVSLAGMPYVTLMPVFARDILHGGAGTLGWLMTSVGMGAVVGALYLASRRDVTGFAGKMVVATGLMSAGLVGFAWSRSFWLSFLLLSVIGFSVMVEIAASNTIVQTIVPDDMRGRVMGLFAMSFLGVAPFGSLLAGAAAQRIGAPATLSIGAAACLIAAAAFTTRLRSFSELARHIPTRRGVPEEIAEGLRAAASGVAAELADDSTPEGTPAEPLPNAAPPHRPREY